MHELLLGQAETALKAVTSITEQNTVNGILGAVCVAIFAYACWATYMWQQAEKKFDDERKAQLDHQADLLNKLTGGGK